MQENQKGKVLNPETCYISEDVTIEENVVIYPNNYIEGKTIIKSGAVLLPNNFIRDSFIGENTQVFNSVIENSIVEDGVSIGPFAHLRPESKIESGVKIGNFVEIKKSKIGAKTKVSHLTYVGDADVGKNVNIGCGVVFVNYNGKIKQKTVVEDNCFIGSSVNLIAPITVEEKAFICAGTTVDKNVEQGDFVIGRSRMTTKKGRAINYLKGDN